MNLALFPFYPVKFYKRQNFKLLIINQFNDLMNGLE